MRVIIGYGNNLRGEDAFGVDCIKELEKYKLKDTILISTFQLTPEIVLELLDCDEIVFIDASYSIENQYKLACSIEQQNSSILSHHITPKTIIKLLNTIYDNYPTYKLYSMSTNSFDKILNTEQYTKSIKRTVSQIRYNAPYE